MAAFDEGASALEAFAKEFKHCNIPQSYIDAKGFKLGQWVAVKRGAIKRKELEPDKLIRLEAISGWSAVRTDDPWPQAIEEFRAYVSEFGNGLVPQDYVSKAGFKLGSWVGSNRQMYARGTYSNDKKVALEQLTGWTWNSLDSRWDEGFSHLIEFWDKNHRWPSSTERCAHKYRVGGWLNNQRSKIRSGGLSASQEGQLESLSGWILDPRKEDQHASWNLHFSALEKYVREYGDAAVPTEFVTRDGVKLGAWVQKCRVRIMGGRGTLDASQIARLLAMPGWTNSLLQSNYEQAIHELKAIAAKGDILSITNHFVTPSGFRLGQWCGVRRTQYKQGKLSAERIAQLESITGWVWDKNEADWLFGYQSLLDWVKVNGTARVPALAQFKGFKLGSWVRGQREAKREGWRTMTRERQKALEALPGWLWDPTSASGKSGGFKQVKGGQ
jgi:hypothetical protein